MDTLRGIIADSTTTVELWGFIINLILAAVISFGISAAYVWWGTSFSNRSKAAGNFVLLAVITTFVITIIKSSLALSLGLVGALSIVRFRTAIKEPEELTFLFLAIATGLGLGANQRVITIAAVAVALLIIGIRRAVMKHDRRTTLHLIISGQNSGEATAEEVVGILKPLCSKLELVRLDDTRTEFELSFLAEFRSFRMLTAARSALRTWSKDVEIRFLDDEGLD